MIIFNKFKISDKGQGMVEYGLILVLVSVVVIGVLTGIGGNVDSTFGGLFDGASVTEPLLDQETHLTFPI